MKLIGNYKIVRGADTTSPNIVFAVRYGHLNPLGTSQTRKTLSKTVAIEAEWDTFESQQRYIEWCMQWIAEAHRVLSDTGTLYITGFSEILAHVKVAASPMFAGCKWLVW